MIFHIPKRNTKRTLPVWTFDFLYYKYSKLQACVVGEKTCLDGLGVGQQISTMRIHYVQLKRLNFGVITLVLNVLQEPYGVG